MVDRKKIQLGYDKYTQDSSLHTTENMIVLNKKFPNLTAYGFIQYLKELMALNPAAKIEHSPTNVTKMSLMMNMDESLIRAIIAFCVNIGMLEIRHTYRELEKSDEKYLIYPDFLQELINLESKKLGQEAEIRSNKHLLSWDKRHESEIRKKKRLVDEMRVFMLLSEEIKTKSTMYYPDIDIKDAWDEFVDMCESSYQEWHAQLSHENYDIMFYTYLNKRTTKIASE